MLGNAWEKVSSWRWWSAIALGLAGAVIAIITFGRARICDKTSAPESDKRASDIAAAAMSGAKTRSRTAQERAARAGVESAAAVRSGKSSAASIAQDGPDDRELRRRRIAAKLRKGPPFGGAIVLAAIVSASSPALAAEPVISAVHEDDGRTLPFGWYLTDAEHREISQWMAELLALRAAHAESRVQVRELTVALNEERAASSICTASLAASESMLESRDIEIARTHMWFRRPPVVAGLSFFAGVVITGAIVIKAAR